MKKFYTLLCIVLIATSLKAQVSATSNILLDYDGIDNQYSTDNGYDYTGYLWNVNSRYTNTDNLNLRYAAVRFDTIQFLDANNMRVFYPRPASTLRLDSFTIAFIHQHNTGNADSIRFTVFNTNAAVVTNFGTPNSTFTTPPLWDTLIITNSTIPLNTTNYTFATFSPNISLPQGQTFGIRVDFAGDTANKFNLIAGYRDQCAAACAAEISAAGNNSAYYLNFTTTGPVNQSGYYENNEAGAIYYDCDASGGFTPGGCENFYIQNFWMYAYVSATINYGVVIVLDSSQGCPGASLNMYANAFGSAATPYTYSWSTTNGTLSSTTDQQVALIIGTGNATVNVTVTDANNVTTIASTAVSVNSLGINISITNSNPLTISCGTNVTLVTSISGHTTGKNYSWSTGTTGTTASTIQVNTPGNYNVTVTNNTGCSASASIAVQYPGNLTNTASFSLPPAPRCEDIPLTFINTSQRLNGWTPQWTFGDGNLGFTLNGTNTYANPGVYTIQLQIDSAGCIFKSNNVNITVLAGSNAACLNPPLTVTLGVNQSVCNGSHVILSGLPSNGIPPYTYNWSSTGSALSCNTCGHPAATITQNSIYTVTVIDANNKTATASVNYTVTGGNNLMQVSATNTIIDCANPLNTTVVTVTNGASPYTFYWGNATFNSGTSPQTHNYSQAGEYVIAVQDASGCVSSILDTVEYQGIFITANQVVHPVCEHSNTGKIKVSATGGTLPYTFLWSNNATTDSIKNVPAYNYTVIVTDVTSCTASALFNLGPQDGWGYHVFLDGANANCVNNGSVTSNVSGGTNPFNYVWSNGANTSAISGLGSGVYSVTVTDGLGCTAAGNTSVYTHCVSIISGIAFVDTNNNCTYNVGEQAALLMNIVATQNGTSYYSSTSQNGHYSIEVPTSGTYTLTAYNYNSYGTCGYLTLCSSPNQTVTITTPGDSSINNNFAFVGNTGFDFDLFVRWHSANPGFNKEYWIYPSNYSQVPFTGQPTVTFTYDSNLIYQTSTPPAAHNLTAHTLTWVVDSLNFGYYSWDELYSSFLVPVNMSLSSLLQSDFLISPTAGDCYPVNNHLHTSEVVTGSYDPNEKTVEPAGNIIEQDSVLTYTIHFQNTGTDSTHFIIVTDTLSNNLNPATVRNIASSHPYSNFTISGEGILTWTFNPLRLVDSFTNEPGSKGFVKFTVKKRNNLNIGSIISNRSSIYFDYNEPVMTNTVADTISLPSYIFEVRSEDNISVKAFPNPFSDVTSIVVVGLKEKFNFELYDITGSLRKRISSIETSKFELQREELSPAIYFYRITTGAGKGTYGKLIVQ